MSQQNINNYNYYYDINQPTYPSNAYSTFIATIPTETNFTQQSLYASDYRIHNDQDHYMEPFGNTQLDNGVISINTDYMNNSNPQIQKLVETSNCSLNDNNCSCYKFISCEKTECDQAGFATPGSYQLNVTPRHCQNFEQNEEIPCGSIVLYQSQNEPIVATPLSTVIHQNPINPSESLTKEQTDDHISSKYYVKKTSTMIVRSETSPEILKKYETCEEFIIYYEKRYQVYEDGEMETFEEQVVKMDRKVKVEVFNGYS
ncbi:16495_t:CDS:1 [Dentiscutata erythropus]|uniref:16495_t:CDS:1 n=1 Tax=Dentiscutata erythropus TaxID=1348616 RepID=A0A9N8ZIE3_9GLOM|nr:16495_t:CDS:1 [Dentiscutata erythropus]